MFSLNNGPCDKSTFLIYPDALKLHPAQEGGEYSPNVSSVKDSPPTGGRITSSLVEGGRHRNSNSPPARTRPVIGPLFQHGETH